MSDEKRKTLTLKRKSPETTKGGADSVNDTNTASTLQVPRVVGRKKVVTVTTPPAWKVKKQALAAKVPPKIETPPASPPKSVEKAKKEAVPRQVKVPKGVKLIPLYEAITEMKTYWPGLFDGDVPRLMAVGTFEKLVADKQLNAYPISNKQIKRCLKSITRSKVYLSQTVVGAPRYDIQGHAVATVEENEQQYAVERLKRFQ
ncbi:FinO family plasmid conjugative transfer fertility inhibition protein [Hafnia paralvei ATCC 29927]|uniref:fertility inhibition protein FinO n=1 Tax=Hafnia paralvei TaxID=546367 RepID=UPI0007E3F24E|nr:fertility inhibition protein FinO [Hafnia paralvei]OAT36015.1 FinO family plasmid conjugative transfer fertility inhibition protein [Hafnia paralvei ATCC 29927]